MTDGPENRAASWTKRTKAPQLIVDPPDGKVPVQSSVVAKRQELAAANTGRGNVRLENIDPQTRCLPPGVPRSNYAVPYSGYQIIQSPGYVTILSEWNHTYRIIPVNARPRVGEAIRLWMGDSQGRWQGNTLIVDTTNLTDKTWLDMGGTFHSNTLHVVERYTRVDADTIAYEATLDDPKVFTRPWKVAFEFKRPEKGYKLFEYACHEGNYGLPNMLSAARAEASAKKTGAAAGKTEPK